MKKVFPYLNYLIKVHLLALIFLFLFRLLFFYIYRDHISTPNSSALLFDSFVMGLRFDNVTSCYIQLLPLILTGIMCQLSLSTKRFYTFIQVFFAICYSIVLLIAAADIPYFGQFFKHLNASVWNWFSEPSFVIEMITKETSFIVYVFLFIGIDVLFCFLLARISRKQKIETQMPSFTIKQRVKIGALFLVAIAFCTLGIRGRIGQKSPIRIGTAYFCEDPFINQLGLNPAFVFLRTTLDMEKQAKEKITLMDEKEAINNVRKWLQIDDSIANSSLIAREIKTTGAPNERNVVIILMESMASHYIQNPKLTPFLNRLIKKSDYFPNTYSAGIHTMNGLAGTFFASPALLNQHPFKTNGIFEQPSIFGELKKRNYQTAFFFTHDEQFDNMGGFFSANHVEKIVAEKDYPLSEVHSNLGVSDDFFFENAIPYLRREASNKRPFVSAFLTASNHQPFIIPAHYKPSEKEPYLQAVQFADYSLECFFKLAEKEPWFKNTIFVLLADHGKAHNDYDVSLTYHHIPLIIYDPQEKAPKVHNQVAGQVDVFPTIMGLLNIPYINETLGINLFKEKREQIFFSSDDAYGCVDSTFYFVHRMGAKESLYNYKKGDLKDILSAHKEHAAKLNLYAMSMMQTAQYLVDWQVNTVNLKKGFKR